MCQTELRIQSWDRILYIYIYIYIYYKYSTILHGIPVHIVPKVEIFTT